MPDIEDPRRMFQIFNEIGIIAQLSRALFEARLPEGAGLPHFTLLNHLMRVRDGQTPLALARAFQVPKTTMTHTLSGAERHGWVDLRPNPRDGRSKTVWLTLSGRTFRDQAIAALGPDLADVADSMDGASMAILLEKLTELRLFLDARRNHENGSTG
ncbi:MAG: MarR family transcriptional regulator [Jannaschia sp.]